MNKKIKKILNKAIGKNLYCIFVNTGLLRKNEEKQVVATFKKRLKINLTYVNAEKEFIRKLSKISDPQKKINILKEADHYFIQALRDHNLYHKIWQAYAALLPVKTVGVMGDNRTYEYLCLLRAITSEDGMTADFYEFKKSFIQEISNKIVNSIRGINRVVYDITSKPPSTIELE